MSRQDFKARLEKLRKVPSVGARRAVNQAMLQDKIAEIRARADEDRAQDTKDGPDSISAGLMVVVMVSFLVLAGLYAQDPAEAARKAVIMVPLMVLFLIVAALREFRRTGWGYLSYNFLVDLDFLARLLRLFR